MVEFHFLFNFTAFFYFKISRFPLIFSDSWICCAGCRGPSLRATVMSNWLCRTPHTNAHQRTRERREACCKGGHAFASGLLGRASTARVHTKDANKGRGIPLTTTTTAAGAAAGAAVRGFWRYVPGCRRTAAAAACSVAHAVVVVIMAVDFRFWICTHRAGGALSGWCGRYETGFFCSYSSCRLPGHVLLFAIISTYMPAINSCLSSTYSTYFVLSLERRTFTVHTHSYHTCILGAGYPNGIYI